MGTRDTNGLEGGEFPQLSYVAPRFPRAAHLCTFVWAYNHDAQGTPLNRIAKTLIALALIAAVGIVACGDEPTPPEPVPGDLIVTVVSPNGVEGAAVLETADAGIIGVSAENAQVFHWRAGGLSRVVLLLDQPGELRFRLSVQDLSRPPNLRIVEVADGENSLRASHAGYVVRAVVWTGV